MADKSIGGGIAVAASGMILGTLGLTAILNLTTWFGDVLRPSVPDGAVMAFDLAEGCPAGWDDVDADWRGRTLVAAAREPNDTDYGFGKRSGSPTHVLQIDEIPQHTHGGKYVAFGVPNTGTDKLLVAPSTEVATVTIDEAVMGVNAHPGGATAPHNNMPPYIALYFCKKEG